MSARSCLSEPGLGHSTVRSRRKVSSRGRPKGRVPLVKDRDRRILLSAFCQLYRRRGEKLGRGVKAQVFRALAELQLGARSYRKSDLPKVRSWLAKNPRDKIETDIDHWQQLTAAARTLKSLPSIDNSWTGGDIFNDPAKAQAFTQIRVSAKGVRRATVEARAKILASKFRRHEAKLRAYIRANGNLPIRSLLE